MPPAAPGTSSHATSARFTAIVSGSVQGVGYRGFVRGKAVDMGLAGHVENMSDGRVEVVAEGARADLEVLLVRMRVGPTHAEVSSIEVEWGVAGGLRGFYAY